MRAIQKLEAGWTQHRLRRGSAVCMLGSLDDALIDVIAEQYATLDPSADEQSVRMALLADSDGLYAVRQVLASAVERRLPQSGVADWNDRPERRKEEVLEVMRSVLEDVMLETFAEAESALADSTGETKGAVNGPAPSDVSAKVNA
jgi:hypothetical protein